MDTLDDFLTVKILSLLNDEDLLKLCSMNRKINKICKKYADNIWIPRLESIGIKKEEIVGTPMSYYLGTKFKKYNYYFYEIEEFMENTSNIIWVERVVNISQEDAEFDDHFKIPSLISLKGHKVYVGIFTFYSPHGSAEEVAVSKDRNITLDKLIKNVKNEIWDEMDADIEKKIESMETDTKLVKNIIYNGGIGWDIPMNAKIIVQFFRVTLP